jgi:peptidoglycan/xylan/chitin deacetylase (PgdA/CDA1 family)
MCVSPRHFEEQLDVLQRLATPVPLERLARDLEAGAVSRGTVAVTLDDGYADCLHAARPLLARADVPATVFVASGYLGREFWWDALARIALGADPLPGPLSLDLAGEPFAWPPAGAAVPTSGPQGAAGLLDALYQRLLPLSEEKRDDALAAFSAWSGAAQAPAPVRALQPQELVELASDGLVDVGAHTVSHPVLERLEPAAQEAEIAASRSRLAELIGREIKTFSYPNGSAPEHARAVVRRAGFLCACASFPDVVSVRSARDHLPRFWIPDWDGARFERWLRRWL